MASEAFAKNYIDLHMHLDGAITLPMARRLMELCGEEDLSEEELKKRLTVSSDCKDLSEFLDCFAYPVKLMQTKETLSECAFLVLEEAKKNGVIYMEVRFAPQLHLSKGLSQEEVVSAVLEGMGRSSLKANLILCMMRGEGNRELNRETLRLAKKYLTEDGGVVALDLAGAEAVYSTKDYEDLFLEAKEAGIPVTIHAGEADGPESVADAIRFGAKRIGHGVRIREDEEVLKLAREKGVTLEMCPTSNRLTRAFTDMEHYPMKEYLSGGLKVTLNTDDPGIEGITLAEEYRYGETTFGLSAEDEKTLLSNAIEAAFTSASVKASLYEKLGLKV